MGQIAGEQDEVRTLRTLIEKFHRAFERLGPQRVRRALEAHMRIAELGEGKTLRWFAVGFFEEIADRVRFGAMGQERRELVDNADAERHPRRSQEPPPGYLVFHLRLRFIL